MRVFLDVSFIGADGFQKGYIFFKWKLRLSARKKSYKASLISSVLSERRNDTPQSVVLLFYCRS